MAEVKEEEIIQEQIKEQEEEQRDDDTAHEKEVEYHSKKNPIEYDTKTMVLHVLGILVLCVAFLSTVISWKSYNRLLLFEEEISSQNNRLMAEVLSLKGEVAVLNNELDSYVEDDQNKVINITVNADGTTTVEEQDVTENPEAVVPEENPFDARPFLGVGFSDVENSTSSIGLRVDYVYEYSPAQTAGLKSGDILMALNGIQVHSYEELTQIIDSLNVEDMVELTFATISENGIEIITVSTTLTYRGNYDLE